MDGVAALLHGDSYLVVAICLFDSFSCFSPAFNFSRAEFWRKSQTSALWHLCRKRSHLFNNVCANTSKLKKSVFYHILIRPLINLNYSFKNINYIF